MVTPAMDLIPVRPIGRAAGEPLYEQVAAQLRRLIREGQLGLGEKVPPERVLVDEFQVSRVTVRRAVDALVDEHLLIRRPGSGTFVVAKSIPFPLVGLHSTRDIERAHGLDPEVRILDYEVREASALERSKLELAVGKAVLSFVRQDSIKGKPICVAHCVLPARFADALSESAVAVHSTYELIETEMNIRISRARQTIRADAASLNLASLLAIEAGAPLMKIDRVTLDTHGSPVEWGVISYPHDEIECVAELTRESANRTESATGFALRFLRAPRGTVGEDV
jgi:GntR family transcriptional regulator